MSFLLAKAWEFLSQTSCYNMHMLCIYPQLCVWRKTHCHGSLWPWPSLRFYFEVCSLIQAGTFYPDDPLGGRCSCTQVSYAVCLCPNPLHCPYKINRFFCFQVLCWQHLLTAGKAYYSAIPYIWEVDEAGLWLCFTMTMKLSMVNIVSIQFWDYNLCTAFPGGPH